MAKYDVNGKPYRTKIDAKWGTSCVKCGRKIHQHRPAIGVRHGLSFFYYHITCWPKSYGYREWKKRGGK